MPLTVKLQLCFFSGSCHIATGWEFKGTKTCGYAMIGKGIPNLKTSTFLDHIPKTVMPHPLSHKCPTHLTHKCLIPISPSIGVGTGGGGTGGMCPPKLDKLLYKLLNTLCVVSDCAPPIKKSFLHQCHYVQLHSLCMQKSLFSHYEQ